VGAPGYEVLNLGDHRTLWLYRDWKLHESIGEWVNTCADDLEQFFGLEAHLAPMHVVIGPPGLYGPRVGNAAGYAFPEYSAATVDIHDPGVRCVEQPESSPLCSIARHEVTHIVHSWALQQEGYSFFDAGWWMSEGHTGQMEQLTSEESYLTWPSWSPDGSRLALVDADRNRVGVLDLATRDIEWLDVDPYSTQFTSRPRWLSNESLVASVYDTEYRVVALSFNLSTHTMSTWGGHRHMAPLWILRCHARVSPTPVYCNGTGLRQRAKRVL